MKINIQSYIDVITNSSTSVYQVAGCDSVEMVESLIDTILKMGGSGMRCKDVFKIKLEADSDNDRYLEYALGEMDLEEDWNDSDNYEKYQEVHTEYDSEYSKDYNSRDYNKINALEKEMIEIGLNDGVIQSKEDWVETVNEEECYNGGHPIETRIVIEPINYIPSSRQTEILESINYLFDNYASYD